MQGNPLCVRLSLKASIWLRLDEGDHKVLVAKVKIFDLLCGGRDENGENCTF